MKIHPDLKSFWIWPMVLKKVVKFLFQMRHFKLFSCFVIFSILLATFTSAQEGQRRAVRKRKLIQGFVDNNENNNRLTHHDEVGENRPKAKQRRKRPPTESQLLDVPYEPEGEVSISWTFYEQLFVQNLLKKLCRNFIEVCISKMIFQR